MRKVENIFFYINIWKVKWSKRRAVVCTGDAVSSQCSQDSHGLLRCYRRSPHGGRATRALMLPAATGTHLSLVSSHSTGTVPKWVPVKRRVVDAPVDPQAAHRAVAVPASSSRNLKVQKDDSRVSSGTRGLSRGSSRYSAIATV